MSNAWLSLRGRDFPDLGRLGIAELRGVGALALSRGAHPKSYSHLDPNEDGALLFRSSAGVLLAVVDGYNGVAASEATLDAVRCHAASLLAPSQEAFHQSVANVVSDVSRALASAHHSRTCLALVARGPEECRWASFGDCAIFRASSPLPINEINEFVLGRQLRVLPRPADIWAGSFSRLPDERIGIASDGVTNFTADLDGITRMLRESPDDLQAARDIAEAAMTGGAGDNVTAAVIGS